MILLRIPSYTVDNVKRDFHKLVKGHGGEELSLGIITTNPSQIHSHTDYIDDIKKSAFRCLEGQLQEQ